MSFVLNDAGIQQISFFESCNSLTDHEKKFLEKSWATCFAKHIFPKIDERFYCKNGGKYPQFQRDLTQIIAFSKIYNNIFNFQGSISRKKI